MVPLLFNLSVDDLQLKSLSMLAFLLEPNNDSLRRTRQRLIVLLQLWELK